MANMLALYLGIPVEDVTMEEAVDRCAAMVEAGRRSGRTHQVATINVDFLIHAREDADIRSVLQRADLAIPDGMPVVWGSRALGTPLRERVAGADLVPALAAMAAERGYKVHLWGSAPGVAEAAAALLRSQYPGAQVTGAGGPFFDRVEDMDPTALDEIREIQPDILCVALGHPKQERWIEAYRHKLGVPVLIGVGGSLDFLVGTKSRAPVWMRKFGFEWAHRLATEPRRLAGRYARDLTYFVPLLAQERRRTHTKHPYRPPVVDVVCADDLVMLRPVGHLDLTRRPLSNEAVMALSCCKRVVIDTQAIDLRDRTTVSSLVIIARLANANGATTVLAGMDADDRKVVKRLRLDWCFSPAAKLDETWATYERARADLSTLDAPVVRSDGPRPRLVLTA